MTQREEILNHLQSGGYITPIEALEWFGCFRLASRISELKKEGYPIQSKMVLNRYGKKFSRYSLEIEDEKHNGTMG